jgi:hypothetical protein
VIDHIKKKKISDLSLHKIEEQHPIGKNKK